MEIQTMWKAFNEEDYELLTKEYQNQNQKLEYSCPNEHRRTTTWKNWKKGSRCLICRNQSTKPTIKVVKDSFEKEGYTLLSDTYISNKVKLEYLCSNEHKNSITWSDWNSGGYRCPDCANNKKLSIEHVILDFNLEGYIFVGGDYINNTSILIIKCSKGHEFETSRGRWTTGNRCPTCYYNRINIDTIKESFELDGYKLLSKEYIDAHTKLNYICTNGHEHKISWAAWQQGERCFYCRNENARLSLNEIKDLFISENYKFIEDSYSNYKLKYVCDKEHIGETTIGNWKSGNRCAICYGNAKLEFDYVKTKIESENYIVVTDKYVNNRDKLHLICPKGHDYYASWFDWNSNKVRCYKCKDRGTSLQEQELIDNLKLLNLEMEIHDRYIINPYELDIIFPNEKIAIEYCGLYWHSELSGKDKKYHLNKLEKCIEKGYKLITIFEDEFVNKKEIVFSKLNHILSKNNNISVIYARKCIIKPIPTIDAFNFCTLNHIQGYTGSSIKIGAYFDDQLVAVMTFSKPSISKGQHNRKKDVWELSRFCTSMNIRVIGIASKLLSFFKNNYDWSIIFSYADRRWSIGNLYATIGFDFKKFTPPNYWYMIYGNIERKHRFLFRKTKDDDQYITEWENRKSQGLNRIWDCGNILYVMKNSIK